MEERHIDRGTRKCDEPVRRETKSSHQLGHPHLYKELKDIEGYLILDANIPRSMIGGNRPHLLAVEADGSAHATEAQGLAHVVGSTTFLVCVVFFLFFFFL